MDNSKDMAVVLGTLAGKQVKVFLDVDRCIFLAQLAGTVIGPVPGVEGIWSIKTRATQTEQGIMPSGIVYFKIADVSRVFDDSDDAAAASLLA